MMIRDEVKREQSWQGQCEKKYKKYIEKVTVSKLFERSLLIHNIKFTLDEIYLLWTFVVCSGFCIFIERNIELILRYLLTLQLGFEGRKVFFLFFIEIF